MLIVYKFNFELTIIGFLLILRRGEEFHNVVFGKQGTAQNTHDLLFGRPSLRSCSIIPMRQYVMMAT